MSLRLAEGPPVATNRAPISRTSGGGIAVDGVLGEVALVGLLGVGGYLFAGGCVTRNTIFGVFFSASRRRLGLAC